LKSKPAGLVVEGEALQRWVREAEAEKDFAPQDETYRSSANAIAV